MILSTVRCNCHRNVGFLANQNRAVVAISRAMNRLVIVGHKDTVAPRGIWLQVLKASKCIPSAGSMVQTKATACGGGVAVATQPKLLSMTKVSTPPVTTMGGGAVSSAVAVSPGGVARCSVFAEIARVMGSIIDENGGFVNGTAAGLIKERVQNIPDGLKIGPLVKNGKIPGIVWDPEKRGVRRQ